MFNFTSAATRLLKETSSFVWKLLCIAIVLGLGGIYYAYLENEQEQLQRQLANIHRDISICHMQTSQLHAKAENLTNRWALLDRLDQNKSELDYIQTKQIEFLSPDSSPSLAHNEH